MSELLFTLVEFSLGFYLTWRQRRVCCTHTHVPAELSGIMDAVTFEQARRYALHKIHFSMIKDIFTTVVEVSMTYFRARNVLLGVARSLVGSNNSDMLLSATLLIIMSTCSIIVELPFDVYFNFVLEEKYGFNRMTAWYYIKDRVKVFILSKLFIFLAASAAIYIITHGGDYFYIYLWLFCAVCSFLAASLYVVLVVPIFHSFVPFPDHSMLPHIQNLFERVNFPISRLKVLQASVRSTHTNAFFSGIYKTKTVVMFDTLLEGRRLDTSEVLAILGHELGHWKSRHVQKLMATSLTVLLCLLVVFGNILKQEVHVGRPISRFIVRNHYIVYHTLALFFSHRMSFVSFGISWMSRSFEYEADAFAASLGLAPALRTALINIHNANLEFPLHDWLYANYHHNHPSLLHRLEELRRFE